MFQLPCTAKCFARFVKFALELQWGYLSECKTSTIARVLIDIADTRGVTYLIDIRWKLHAQPRAFIRIFILTISHVGFDFKWQTSMYSCFIYEFRGCSFAMQQSRSPPIKVLFTMLTFLCSCNYSLSNLKNCLLSKLINWKLEKVNLVSNKYCMGYEYRNLRKKLYISQK